MNIIIGHARCHLCRNYSGILLTLVKIIIIDLIQRLLSISYHSELCVQLTVVASISIAVFIIIIISIMMIIL